MQQSLNPWITRRRRRRRGHGSRRKRTCRRRHVISAPLRGMVEPDAADRLGRRTVSGSAALWVTGAHGDPVKAASLT